MKTPREILFQRHQSAEPKLDDIRKTTVAAVCDRRFRSPAVIDQCHHWREFLISLRWHLGGMGTAWLAIILLHLNVGHAVDPASALPRGRIPPPQIILTALRENRRELLEVMQPTEVRDARPSKLFPAQPRSERPDETLMA
ncbi:MAG TPA: hypothetical protein VMA35_04505 [Candidatus Sulfopaludibacter sp.]|nr:hypothetical protein [Candidatus Sulfopaludibacter sp.]